MKKIKRLIRFIWNFGWELILVAFFAVVGVILIPLDVIATILISIYTKKTPFETHTLMITKMKNLLNN